MGALKGAWGLWVERGGTSGQPAPLRPFGTAGSGLQGCFPRQRLRSRPAPRRVAPSLTWEPFASRRGEVINGGFGLVLDGTQEAEQKAKMVLSWDVSNGVSDRPALPISALPSSQKTVQSPCCSYVSPPATARVSLPFRRLHLGRPGLFPAQPVSAGGPGGVACVPAGSCACGVGLHPSRWPRRARRGKQPKCEVGGDGGICRCEWNGEGLGSPTPGLDLGGPGGWRGRAPAEGAGPVLKAVRQ